MKRSRLVLGLVLACSVGAWSHSVEAQTTRNFEGIETVTFQRSADDVLVNLQRYGAKGATLSDLDQFRLDYYSGNWKAVAGALAELPSPLPDRTYDKMLADLTSRGEPFMLLDDVLGVAQTNPSGTWSAARLKSMGLVVKAGVPPMQRRWLEEQLETGVNGLGGKEPDARLNAGRVLIHAGFDQLASRFLPKPEDAGLIDDPAARAEVLAFYAIREEAEQVEQASQPASVKAYLDILKDPASSPQRMRDASNSLFRQAGQLPPAVLDSAFSTLIKDNPSAAHDLLVNLVKQYRNGYRSGQGRGVSIRQNNLHAMLAMAGTVMASKGDDPAWKPLLELMADYWVLEGRMVFEQRKGTRASGMPDAIDAQEAVITAPAGEWFKALPKPLAESVTATLITCIITLGDFDQAATLIVELSKNNADAAVEVAENFLTAWGEQHDPNLPEALRKKFGLPQEAHIAVTPVMMENNIRNLARIMALFREAGVQWKDNARIVNAFDAAYGNAEAYKLSHIEQVFGTVPGMSEGLVLQMMSRMSESLSNRWRNMEVQRGNLTGRSEQQTLQMVRDGYAAALQIADEWLAVNGDGYRVWTMAGTMMNDWADFEYFQKLAAEDGPARTLAFTDKQNKAQAYFAKGAEAYGRAAASLPPASYTIDPYVAWFRSLLGLNSSNDINLTKSMNRAALQRLRDAMRALPAKASTAHINLFARWVDGRLRSTSDPLHEELKYKFLASSLIITQDNPFTLQTQQQVEYYDQLLSEIHLKTSIDGPTTVGRDQDFGVVLSVVHTEAMGRMAKFGQYLSNARPADGPQAPRGPRNPLMPRPLRLVEAQGPRDELELSIRDAFEPFFDIRSITFSRPEVAARPTEKPGWQETVLAYVDLRAKDASVDRVPPVEINLSFLDMSGPVRIPARSAETLIKVTSPAPGPRPADNIQLIQTLDPRQYQNTGGLTLRITATATGLVPDLDEIIDFAPLASTAEVRTVSASAGALVKELHSWGERVTADSERDWTVVLDASKARDSGLDVMFAYPTARRPDVTILNRTYDDMELVDVQDATVALGQAVSAPIAPKSTQWMWLAVVGVALVTPVPLALLIHRRRARGKAAPQLRARDRFKMPEQVDGFVVVRLLNALLESPLVHFDARERAAVREDIQRVQEAVFVPGAAGLSDSDLREIAGKWLARLK